MPELTDHNLVLRQAARSALRPLGLIQKGRSRTWLDDRGWHLIVVEFQPSSFSKGSYLNVGVMWLWHAKPDLSFDHGDRIAGFEGTSDGDWAATARALGERAAERVERLRAEVSDVRSAAALLTRTDPAPGWPEFHAGVAWALSGNSERAKGLFAALMGRAARYAWQRELQDLVRALEARVDDPAGFDAAVVAEIERCRAALKLPALPASEIVVSVRAPRA